MEQQQRFKTGDPEKVRKAMRLGIYKVFVKYNKGYNKTYELRCNYLDEETRQKVEDYIKKADPEREVTHIGYAYWTGQETGAYKTFTIKEYKG